MSDMQKSVGEFALTLLHSVTNVKIHHWLIIDKSAPAHEALGVFCDKLPPLLDALVESIMGYPANFTPVFPVDYYSPETNCYDEIEDLLRYVQETRTQLPSDSDIQNQVDEIVALIKKTRYRLRAP